MPRTLNRQFPCIADRDVFCLDGEGGGSRCGRCAADLAGVPVQSQTGREIAATNAPCDGRSAGDNQSPAVLHTHLAVRQAVRGDGYQNCLADFRNPLQSRKKYSII